MKKTALVILSVLASSLIRDASSMDLVFVGLSGDGAPAVEKTFDRMLREQFSTLPNVNVVDYLQSERYRQKIRFADYPTVSRTLVESLDRIASDSTLFVWGIVKKYEIKPCRHLIVGAAMQGELTIDLTMYSLLDRNYAFAGDVASKIVHTKGIILFGDADTYIQISASERENLLEKLDSEVVQKSAIMVNAVVRSETEKSEQLAPQPFSLGKYRVPALRDVFKVPPLKAPATTAQSDSLKASSDSSGTIQTDSSSAKAKPANPSASKPSRRSAAKTPAVKK